MNSNVKPVSRRELAEEIEKSEKPRPIPTKTLYSSGDVAKITGWSRSYVLRLERSRKDFPKAKRIGLPRGNPKWVGGKDHLLRPRFWDEDGLRMILGFKKEQDLRMGRL